MTNLEAKQSLARKLDIDYVTIANNELFSDADLQELIQSGLFEAWDLHPWPFTEDTYTISSDAQGVSDGFYDSPEELMLGSIRRLAVGGKEFKGPVRFEDYLKYFEDNADGNDKIWSPHQVFIFINPNAYTVGDDIDILGKDLPPKLSADDDLLPFSTVTDDKEHSGNEAIVDLAYARALESNKLNDPNKAGIIRKDAYAVLSILWKPFSEFKSMQQSQDRPMFEVPDFFGKPGNTPGNF